MRPDRDSRSDQTGGDENSPQTRPSLKHQQRRDGKQRPLPVALGDHCIVQLKLTLGLKIAAAGDYRERVLPSTSKAAGEGARPTRQV